MNDIANDFRTGETKNSLGSALNPIKEYARSKYPNILPDIDTVEISGLSQADKAKIEADIKAGIKKSGIETIRLGGKAVHIYDDDYDDVFKALDMALKQLKRESEEFGKYIKKYREEQKRKKRLEEQRILERIALMKKSGLLWVSDLSLEARQVVMHNSTDAISDYNEKKKQEQERADKR
ncbi:MAG: hypothetical protein J1F64_03715 [Oscillospiraceae bacterium]|nr:hypothetical protein [Oscillospiraceae bacterium]